MSITATSTPPARRRESAASILPVSATLTEIETLDAALDANPVLADMFAADPFGMANVIETWLKGQRTAARYARQGVTA